MIYNLRFEIKLYCLKTREIPSYEPNFSSTFIIQAFTNLDNGSLPILRISEVLLYYIVATR
jgi:hypothetical protein